MTGEWTASVASLKNPTHHHVCKLKLWLRVCVGVFLHTLIFLEKDKAECKRRSRGGVGVSTKREHDQEGEN